MQRIFSNAWWGPVCIIGADIPDISKHHICKVFKVLKGNDWVFGPAPDGCYWLIGTRRISLHLPNLFKKVRWSSKDTLYDTLKILPNARVGLIDALRDIDTLSDLQKCNL